MLKNLKSVSFLIGTPQGRRIAEAARKEEERQVHSRHELDEIARWGFSPAVEARIRALPKDQQERAISHESKILLDASLQKLRELCSE